MATLYGLLYHYSIHDLFDVKYIIAEENVASASVNVLQWITDHFAYVSLFAIVNATIASYLVFKKQGYNLAEHLVLNTFYMGLILVITLITLPILYVYKDTEPVQWYPPVTWMMNFVLMYWCYAQFFNKMPKIKSLGFTLLNYLTMTVINLFIG